MSALRAIFLSFSIFIFGSFSKQNTEWDFKKAEDGIFIYTRNIESSKYKELKAVFEIQSTLSGIIALLNDVDACPKWMFQCAKAVTLMKESDQHFIRYQLIDSPWPVDNRDLIGEVRTHQDNKTKIVYQNVVSVPDYIPVSKDYVRIRVFKASWILKPVKKGTVSVEYQLLVDPAGDVPSWFVNLSMVDGPLKTIQSMKKLVQQKEYQQKNFAFINPE